MSRKNESLLRRVFAVEVLLVGALAAVLTVVFLLAQHSAFEQQMRLRAETLAEFVASQSEFAMLVGDRPELGRIAGHALGAEDVLFVVIADASGEGPIVANRPGIAPPILSRPAGGTPAARTARSLEELGFLEVSRLVMRPRGSGLIEWEVRKAASGPLGTVRIGFSTEKQRALFARTIRDGVAVAASSLLLILVVQFLEVRRLLNPLHLLADFTRHVGAGDLSQRAPVIRPDEVGQLTAAFNQMVEKLSATTVSRDYVDKIVQSMGDALIVVAPDGTIQTVNQATLLLLGYAADDLLGEPASKIAEPVDTCGPCLSCTTGCSGVEREYRAKDGRRIPVLFNASAMQSEGGRPLGMVWLAQDITERKRVQQEVLAAKNAAEEASQAKSAFLATMSHELRTPLNAIIGYSQLLQEICAERALAELPADLARIEKAGKTLLAIVNDVLDLSKVEAGRMELHLESFDLRSVILDVIDHVQPLVRQNGNQIAVDCAADSGAVYADLGKVRQSLLNLASNACKFTQNGHVWLKAWRETRAGEEWACASVRDTGIGIAPEHIGKLFQAFSQVDFSVTRRHGGTGLGLAISSRFCRMMGGDITVESTPGVGSTFTMRIPANLREPPDRDRGTRYDDNTQIRELAHSG